MNTDKLNAQIDLANRQLDGNSLDQAAETLRRAACEHPFEFKVHSLLRLVLLRQGDWPGLYAEFERFLDRHPSAQTDWEKSCLSLLFGRMPQGWDQYESRWRTPGIELRSEEHISPQPQWRGDSFVGKTLLLRWEQGLGDAIMFVRYAPMVKALGGQVLLEVVAPLVDVLATCPGIDGIIKDGDPLPPFDLQTPLLSLPRIFRTDLDSIPADIPYLAVPNRVPHRESIDKIMAPTEGLLRIGLVWSGGAKHVRDSERSIPPVVMQPLEALPGVVWHSFQTGHGKEMPFPRIVPMGPVIGGSFSDTAYALSKMDLVITVDTSVAHLAGALGIPTLLLVTTFPDWRWLMGRDDSPWYPTMRIYRQPMPGDWASVIAQVVSDLSSCG